MSSTIDPAALLRQQISDHEQAVQNLRKQLAELEQADKAELQPDKADVGSSWPLSQEEYSRYGRQMIVPSVGLKGQLRLHNASVLIIGVGGLGCPAALYIAGAGPKRLGLVDGDTVEVSNLHRQILHNTNTVDKWKVDSAIENLKKFNPHVQYDAYREHLSAQNAIDIVSQYDLVLDCTDHPKSRYLISDACVLLGKPFVSASAQQTDGQLMVLNYPPRKAGDPRGGPCYRCVFPKPPPPEMIFSCGDGGILGPVVGAIGVLQALEAIKLVVSGLSVEDTTFSEFEDNPIPPPTLLIFSSRDQNPFRSVRLRTRRPDCFACSAVSTLSVEILSSGSLDYVAFCGTVNPIQLLSPEERISAREYAHKMEVETAKRDHVLVDVRERVQFDICNIPGSVNIPFSALQGGQTMQDPSEWLPGKLSSNAPIYVVCRLGNDSQVAARKFKESGMFADGHRYIGDIEGGLKAWREQVDESWPDI